MNTSDTLHADIQNYTKALRLPSIRAQYTALAEELSKDAVSYEVYLHQLLDKEIQDRQVRRKRQRIRRAGFPYKKGLEDLHIQELPPAAQSRLTELRRLDFIHQGQNVIFSGNPGTGKTHLAIALGIKACMQDYQVLFTTVSQLIVQILESKSEKKLTTLQSRFEKYDLVICDEFGYISYDKVAAELLFTHLSLRAGRKSTIITTNLSFDRWTEIFGDQVLTAAMVDRLTHKAHLIDMNGESYRLKETKKWIQNNHHDSPAH